MRKLLRSQLGLEPILIIAFLSNRVLSPIDSKTKAQLCLELSMERQKNEVLLRKLKEQSKMLKSYEQAQTPSK